MRRDVTNVTALPVPRRTYAVINSRIYFLRGTPDAREESLYARLAFKEHMFQGGGDRRVFVGLSEKDSDLRARKTIVVLQRVMRDEITIGVYFLDPRFFSC